jgi:LPS export ABC transporter protein LptC
VLVFLVGLAAGSWWLANREGAEEAPAAAGGSGQPGYYLRDATLEQTDETGRLELRVTTARAVQDPATRNVRAETLRVDYFLDAPRTWVMTANGGTLPPDGQSVLLEGDVRLAGRDPVPDAATGVIRTERLRLDVDGSVAATQDPVRIEFGPHVLTAVGLHADLKNDRVHLQSDVHGKFAR